MLDEELQKEATRLLRNYLLTHVVIEGINIFIVLDSGKVIKLGHFEVDDANTSGNKV